jgi:hypothetical protein
MTLGWLESAEEPERVDAWRSVLADRLEGAGVDPEDLWALGAEMGYRVDVSWSARDDTGAYDVTFCRERGVGERDLPLRVLEHSEEPVSVKPWHAYASSPLRPQWVRSLVPELRKMLQSRVPDYMIPAAFVTLDALPGKIGQRV